MCWISFACFSYLSLLGCCTSPQSLGPNLNQLGTTGWPTLSYALGALLGLDSILLGLIVLRCHRMDIQVTHSEMGR